MRVFALSDIHVDYPENLEWIEGLPDGEYQRDALILAGDVTHKRALLAQTFDTLLGKFAQVFFVPGNHELWLSDGEAENSLDKFHNILELCHAAGVNITPKCIGGKDERLWIVPLFSWYTRPEEGPDSLFRPRENDDPALTMWSDNYRIKWPPLGTTTPARLFLRMNESRISKEYDAPVISFSHFLPRQELIFRGADETAPGVPNRNDFFNFSRVAGSRLIDEQIRGLGSAIHVYGHQHRNRHRYYDGVHYISCCLGYRHEREEKVIGEPFPLPALIWDDRLNKDPHKTATARECNHEQLQTDIPVRR